MFTPHRPLHVVEICAGISTGLEALLRAGHSIASYSWADINPDAHAAASHRLLALQARHPQQLPTAALVGWDRRLPFNANCLNPNSLHSFPDGIDLIIAGPPCQPYSDAGMHKGIKDPRSKALIQVARLIQYLDATQPAGVGYIIENVPGTDKHPAIQAMLGTPLHLDAPPGPPAGQAPDAKPSFGRISPTMPKRSRPTTPSPPPAPESNHAFVWRASPNGTHSP